MAEKNEEVQNWLDTLVVQFGAVAGTVHYERAGDLYLGASRNIPDPVLDRVRFVPHGKGMAGLAQVKREPVQTCNLQQDDTGRINPTAKLVGGQAAVAVPVLGGDGGVMAVVGLAFSFEGEVQQSVIDGIVLAARNIPETATSS